MRIRPVLLLILVLTGLIISAWTLGRAPKRVTRALPALSIPQYPCVSYDKNQLHFPAGTAAWSGLFGKFEELSFNGTGHISIVHIGGSHVQGGWLTDKLRYHFGTLSFGSQAERGLVFPYSLAGTNSPKSIECAWTGHWTGARNSVRDHQSHWGMTGISATTRDSVATVTLGAKAYDSTYYSFNRILIFHDGSSNMCVEPDPMVTVDRIFENPVEGYTEFVFHPAVSSFTFKAHRTNDAPGEFIFQGAYLGQEGAGVSYHAIGVNGAGTYSYLRCEAFGKQLSALGADLVVMGIGVNDANVPAADFDAAMYEARYDSLISLFRSANPDVRFLFVTNNDTYYNKRRPNPNALKVREVMHNLARRHEGAVFDLFDVMGGLGSIDAWVDNGLAAGDRIHFTRKGYELQADLMFEAFRKSFGDYLENGGS